MLTYFLTLYSLGTCTIGPFEATVTVDTICLVQYTADSEIK